MPTSVVHNVHPDHVLRLAAIGALLPKLVIEDAPDVPPAPPPLAGVELEDSTMLEVPGRAPHGRASSFTCPACHGALWELETEGVLRYRCRVGHAYGPEAMYAFQNENVEEALWTAYRALEERVALAQRLARFAKARGLARAAQRYEATAFEASRRAIVVRGAVEAYRDPDAVREDDSGGPSA
jgi:two-component system chemotaxis response regulator CheB